MQSKEQRLRLSNKGTRLGVKKLWSVSLLGVLPIKDFEPVRLVLREEERRKRLDLSHSFNGHG